MSTVMETRKRAEILLRMQSAVNDLARLLAVYYASPANHLNWEKLWSFYGINSDTISEVNLAEDITAKLVKLSWQNINIMLFYPESEKIFEDLRLSFRKYHVFNTNGDTKLLLFINARIIYNQRTFSLDSDNLPKKKSTYNMKLIKGFLKSGKYFLFFNSIKELENAPTMQIVDAIMKKVECGYTKLINNIEVFSRRERAEDILMQISLGKRIILPYS